MFFPESRETINQREGNPRDSGRYPKARQRKRLTLGWALTLVAGSLTLVCLPAIAQSTRLPVRDPQQVPTARYGRGESVELSLIVEEWRDRYPDIPVYTCSCNAESCGDDSVWPFRAFTRYQPFLALGPFNAANSEETGFNCFDIETGGRPQRQGPQRPQRQRS